MTQRGETQQSLSAFPASDLQVILAKKARHGPDPAKTAWADAWAQAEPAAGTVAVSGTRSAQGLSFL